jgi:nicotinate phosphoribosyltransferase
MIIRSLLDTDLYKFTMQQVIWSRFPRAHVEYAFQNRTPGIDLRPFADEIRGEIDALGELTLSLDELEYLRGIRYISSGFVDSLRHLNLDPEAVAITTDGGEFRLHVAGNWYQTILFEVPVLAIVNEVYFRNTHPDAYERSPEGYERLYAKCEQINVSDVPLRIIEFGTRRRYSRAWQEIVLRTLQERIGPSLLGTSNLLFARELGLKPFGTMAHEFLQAGQAFAPLHLSQKFALEEWMQAYRGDLGIALSDVVGMDAFFRDFDLLFSKAYDGARHDSGDPFEWGEKLISHYESLGLDPRLKNAVFSDSLDIPKAQALARRFEGRIRTQFGIGTNLTNDHGFPALQIVIKMVHCNGQPVAKLSDTPGKTMSDDPVFVEHLRRTFAAPSRA